MSWSEQAWRHSAVVYERIIDMPFIRELAAGTLSAERFLFYIAQDSRYLEHFSKALAVIGSRHPDTGAALAFYRFAQTAIVVERVLHESYFREFGVGDGVPIEPACHHYIHFLMSQASMQPVEAAMASVLPCFRIYRDVGKHIQQHAIVEGSPYQRWIEAYTNEDFDRSVEEAIALCDRAAEGATDSTRKAMTTGFEQACRLEYQFWDSAYRLRTWESDS